MGPMIHNKNYMSLEFGSLRFLCIQTADLRLKLIYKSDCGQPKVCHYIPVSEHNTENKLLSKSLQKGIFLITFE